jgi:hypothetical protein
MAIWVDEDEKAKVEPFNGCLIILNIGADTLSGLSADYITELKEHISNAHADGHVTLYIFDIDTSPLKVPDDWDFIEGMDFIRMSFGVCGRRDFNFKVDPEVRKKELSEMVNNLRVHFPFHGSVSITGRCQIDSTPVVMPLVQI